MSSSQTSTEGTPGGWVVATDLVVRYGRVRRARLGLRGFTADFGPGITGLVGPNGAGKTTFLRAVAGLIPPVSGSLRIRGERPDAYVAARGIGFLPETPPLPGHLTVQEFLAGLQRSGSVGEWGRDAGLQELLRSPLESLSMGQRKKVALAAALVGNPEVILLDEPTNGLDPTAARGLRDTLLRESAGGATLILSSHHLDELQRVADVLVFVKGGRVAGSWTRREALASFGTLESLFHNVLGED
jgi:ABC-type multidrug transport system ATPase subunit